MRIGVDIGGTNIKIGIFEEDGSIVEFTEKKVTELTGVDLYDVRPTWPLLSRLTGQVGRSADNGESKWIRTRSTCAARCARRCPTAWRLCCGCSRSP